MLLLEFRVLPFQGLELRDLARRSGWRRLGWPPSEPTVFHILPPFRKHEGMNLERRRDGLHLNSGLLAQANGGELKLVGVASDFAWPRSWHDTSWLGESVYETGASAVVSFNAR